MLSRIGMSTSQQTDRSCQPEAQATGNSQATMHCNNDLYGGCASETVRPDCSFCAVQGVPGKEHGGLLAEHRVQCCQVSRDIQFRVPALTSSTCCG